MSMAPICQPPYLFSLLPLVFLYLAQQTLLKSWLYTPESPLYTFMPLCVAAFPSCPDERVAWQIRT